MSEISLAGLGLEQLSLQMRTFRTLDTMGVANGDDLLNLDPTFVAQRARVWTDLKNVLTRFQNRVSPEEAERIKAFLDSGDAAAEERSRAASQSPTPELTETLSQVYKLLRGLLEPLATRSLARRFKLEPSDIAKLAEEPFITYPFGLHRWVGLRQWSEEGYRKAARAAWNVLPLHLNKLRAKDETLPEMAWQAIYDVSQEFRDGELFLTAHEALELARPQTPEPIPEEPPVRPEEPELVKETAPPIYDAAPRERERAPLRADFQELLAKSEPNLFVDIAVSDFVAAVSAMVAKAKELPRPYSLAELEPTRGDYSWLKRWAKSLDYTEVNEWIESPYPLKSVEQESWSAQEVLGALILFLCCEEGRRTAKEGEVWPTIPSCFGSTARQELFAGEQPRATTRTAIERGARKLGVRHAFGKSGSHAWYHTIYLQFGFTRNGLSALPIWLNQLSHAPTSVESLYNDSTAFRSLWDKLKQYRRRDIPMEEARVAVNRCPFILPSWEAEVLEMACHFTDAVPELTADGEVSPVFTSIRWSGEGDPFVQLEWRNLEGMGLQSSEFEVHCEGERVGRIARSHSGCYQSSPAEITFELSVPYPTLELLGDQEDEEHLIDLVLWDTAEDFHLFDGECGRRLDPEQPIGPRTSLTILTAPGLTVEPPCSLSRMLPGGERLHHLDAGWSELSVIGSDGPVAQVSAKSRPDWVSGCELHCASRSVLSFYDTVSVYLAGLPDQARIVSARAFGQDVTFRKSAPTWDADIRLEPVLASQKLSVRFVVEYEGKKYGFQRGAELAVHDVAIQRGPDQPWQVFQNFTSLNAFELKRAKFRFFIQDQKDHRHALMAGWTILGPPPRGLSALSLSGGFGESLSIWDGPYHRQKEPLQLCESYLNHGPLLSLSIRSDGRFQIELHDALVPSPEHFLLFWNEEGETAYVSPEELELRGTLWVGYLPNFGTEAAVSLGYEDCCIGTAYTQRFQPDWEETPVELAVGLLRWMKLPLLDRAYRRRITELIAVHPLDCIETWLYAKCVQGAERRLSFKDTDEWNGVVRTLFDELELNEEQALNLWAVLQKRHSLNPVELYLKLLSSLPKLALELSEYVLSADQIDMFVHGFCRGTPGSPNLDRLNAMRKSAADDMGVNDAFVDALIETLGSKRTLPRDRENFKVASGLVPFVHYAAVSLFHKNQRARRFGNPR